MKYSLLAICLLIGSVTFGQDASTSIFKMGDRIDVQIDEQQMPYYSHVVAKGHTMYSLARAYKVSLADLYAYNDMTAGQSLSLGATLRIPVPLELLFVGRSLKRKTTGHYIPLYYQTQPKDNLYRLSRQYFPQPMEDLMERNNMLTQDLPLGKDILVGWFSLDKDAAPVTRHEEEKVIAHEEETVTILDNEIVTHAADTSALAIHLPSDSTFAPAVDTAAVIYPLGFNVSLLGSLTYHEDMKCIKKKDVASWDKSLRDNGSVFALHSSAAIDSYIYVFNTNTRRSARIKVIGRIPYGTYTNDINLVLSPRAAIQLGGLDRRFKVEVEYIKE